jgi:TonB family protein
VLDVAGVSGRCAALERGGFAPFTPGSPLSFRSDQLCAFCAALPIAMGATASLAQPEPAVRPPSVETKVDAIYPADQIAAARQVTLVLRITIAADGSVTDPEVIESGGPAFDAAALAAVRQWRFRPALREGVPVPSRIRIPFLFVPPVASAADGGVSQQTANAASAPPSSADAGPTAPGAPPAPVVSSNVDAGVPGAPLPEVTAIPEATAPAEQDGGVPDGGEGVIDVTVLGRRRPPSRGTSDYQIETAQLAQVPHANASDFLKLAPGFLLTNEGGEGHAEQVFLRGFDAREGQDLEFSVDGVPINESGNLHGNGYADTHFIIPELIDSIRVLEGPFDPRQ